MKTISNFLGALSGINIYLYGLGVSLSLILVLFLFWRNIRKTSYSEEKLVDALFAAGVVGLILGRVFQVIFYKEAYPGGLLTWLNLVSYPGVMAFFFWVGFFGYYLLFALRRKYPVKAILKLLLAPIVYGQLLLSSFSLLIKIGWPEILVVVFYILLIGIYFLLTRVLKKISLKEQPILNLVLYLTTPPFMVDFIKEGRVYFFEQKLFSLEQSPYLILFLAALIVALLGLIKRKK